MEKAKQGKRESLPSPTQSLPATLPHADVLLIVPPFHVLNYPSLAVHLLQACGREAGFCVRVLYANMLLAALIGEEAYAKICDAPAGSFAGERFFARCAFGLPPLGRRSSRMFRPIWVIGPKKDWEVRPDFDSYDCKVPITLQELRRLERYAEGWVAAVAREISERHYRIVGCTTSFEQTVASLALLSRIKNLSKDTITILGGANCEGEMGRGIASLPSSVDYIFSGESEASFVKFLQGLRAGLRPSSRLVYGEPCRNMDALPTPSYEEFYEQRRRFLPISKLPPEHTEIPYETSRGCWWGQKHQCTFCGLNGDGMVFRQKSPDRVIKDLRTLINAYPTRKVSMTDRIMPHTYFKTLLPRLAAEFPGLSIFYETRSNFSLPQAVALKRAGIGSIQPGIESLSPRLLTLMNKGVQARQNLAFMRYARAVGISLDWNLLWGFPGDDVKAYQEILAILPLLHHLQAPSAVVHLSIDRFSPYFSKPGEFGVRSIKPLAGVCDFLPKEADAQRIAYHFTAEYPCGAHDHPEVIHKLCQEAARWKAAWCHTCGTPREDLRLFRRGRSYMVVDTRAFRKGKKQYALDEQQASALVTSRPYAGSEFETWALREKLALTADGWFVPLVVADRKILLKLILNSHFVPVDKPVFSEYRQH